MRPWQGPHGGVDRALSEGTFRRPKRDRRSLQGCRTRTAGQSGGRPAARAGPQSVGRRAQRGVPESAAVAPPERTGAPHAVRGRQFCELHVCRNALAAEDDAPVCTSNEGGGPRRAASQKPGRARAFSNFTSRPEGQRAGTAEASMWQERAAPVWGTPASPPRGSHCLPGRDRKSQGACAAASGLEGLDH